MSKWIRKGDRVLVLAGNSKGKMGEVLSRDGNRVIVQDVNLRKKHMKPTEGAQGGRIIEMEAPLQISNVCICDKAGARLDLRVSMKEDGKKVLVYGAKDKETVYRTVK